MSFTIYNSTQPITPAHNKLYFLDLDGTMITSRSGKRWAADSIDWNYLGPIDDVLLRLHSEGYILAVISNQSEWSNPSIQAKVESVYGSLSTLIGWSPWFLVATATRKEKDSVYRKPGIGLFNKLREQLTLNGVTALTDIVMCGDAVGPEDPYPPYRWSTSDKEFADAIGASFVRACDLFGHLTVPAHITPQTHRLLLLVGNPGSGKTSCGRLLASNGFTHIEQDEVGTKAKVKRAVIAALDAGQSVVVDATHGSAVNREPYITLCKERGITCEMLWCIRDGRPFNQLREKPVPEVAYAVYSKHFVAPREVPSELGIPVTELY
jgi:bifunctional polynucleotide phosphatase/kinase